MLPQVEAMTMGDGVAVLNDGVLQQCASPREIYDFPANAFVAGFIGSPAMNLFTLPVTSSGVSLGNWTYALTPGQDVRTDKDIIVGVRPVSWILGSRGLEVRVEHVEELGHESYGYCVPTSTDVDAHSGEMNRIAVHAPKARGMKIGDTFCIAPSDDAVHMFSTSTGARI
ncbi:hypothetical protein J5O04_11390 [Corynebacterium hindlerae]|uniref:hypothetical protein n=1 Tax=Corynebacterium hindlerae TaxID=699041 RepID=UPI001AD70078|nr:hypothetical protein [Corynebacterium hindlerae]QTH59386.1 hypothetical protein J5O04_11390 [Corynebacterium hindlerae]